MVIGVFYFFGKGGRGVSALAKQKLTLAFIAIALVLAIAGYLLQGTSLAWFAVSGEVEANGMTLSANVPANLIISKTAEGLISNAGFLVEFKDSDGRDEMIAVTRDENYTPTYLKRLVSHYAIDATTGLLKDGLDGELEFEAVEASENSKYYVDYVVYVASAYAPLNATSLTATISMPTEVDAFTPYHNFCRIKRLSIDITCGIGKPYRLPRTTRITNTLRAYIPRVDNLNSILVCVPYLSNTILRNADIT